MALELVGGDKLELGPDRFMASLGQVEPERRRISMISGPTYLPPLGRPSTLLCVAVTLERRLMDGRQRRIFFQVHAVALLPTSACTGPKPA